MSLIKKFFKDTNKKEVLSWASYDFANSAYFALILSFIFPIFFREVIAGGGASGDFWWGLAVGTSFILGGLASPIIGAIADHDGRKKRKFIIFSLLSIIGTAALFFTGPNMLLFAFTLFVITNLCFGIAQTFYNSFLPHVSSKETTGRISGLGLGLGFMGSIAVLFILKPLYTAGFASGALYKLTFPLTALFFLLFAIPAFLFLKEHKKIIQKEKILTPIKTGISNTFRTLKDIRKHKKVALFLGGYYILNNALVTMAVFVPIYAIVTLGLTFSQIAIFLIIIRLIGFPSVIFLGWLSDKKGPKKILLIIIILLSLIVLGFSFATPKMFLWMAIPVGFLLGSAPAISRSWFSKIIPKEKTCEFFGFHGLASKVASATGPILFGIISVVTSSQRIAMGTIIIYLAISFVIFARIKE